TRMWQPRTGRPSSTALEGHPGARTAGPTLGPARAPLPEPWVGTPWGTTPAKRRWSGVGGSWSWRGTAHFASEWLPGRSRAAAARNVRSRPGGGGQAARGTTASRGWAQEWRGKVDSGWWAGPRTRRARPRVSYLLTGGSTAGPR